jgi:hypothetical protein
MRTQSAGTGFVAGAFFSFLAALAAGEAFAAGDEDAVGEVVAGFCEHAPATSAIAANRNRNFFIDPPGGFVHFGNPESEADSSLEEKFDLLQVISAIRFEKRRNSNWFATAMSKVIHPSRLH